MQNQIAFCNHQHLHHEGYEGHSLLFIHAKMVSMISQWLNVNESSLNTSNFYNGSFFRNICYISNYECYTIYER